MKLFINLGTLGIGQRRFVCFQDRFGNVVNYGDWDMFSAQVFLGLFGTTSWGLAHLIQFNLFNPPSILFIFKTYSDLDRKSVV